MPETITRNKVVVRKTLRELRREAEVTQVQAAHAIRRSQGYISLAERDWGSVSNSEDITLRALYRLARKAPWMLK